MTLKSRAQIVLGGVGLVRGSIRDAGQLMNEISRELSPMMLQHGFLENAPFSLLNGIIRFGTKFDPFPEKPRIDKRHRELQFAVEVDMAKLKTAVRADIKTAFLKVLCPALYAISSEFDLPTQCLSEYFQVNTTDSMT